MTTIKDVITNLEAKLKQAKVKISQQVKQKRPKIKAEKFEFLKVFFDERHKKAENVELEKAGQLTDTLRLCLRRKKLQGLQRDPAWKSKRKQDVSC